MTARRVIVIAGIIFITIINMIFKINNFVEYEQHIISPGYLRDVYHKYYYKFIDNSVCFPTTSCYEFVRDIYNQQQTKKWIGNVEPSQECTLEDWKTANNENCRRTDIHTDTSYILFIYSIVFDAAAILCVILVLSLTYNTINYKSLEYAICSQSISILINFIINIIVLSSNKIISNELIVILFIGNILSWVIGYILLLILDCMPWYIRMKTLQMYRQSVMPEVNVEPVGHNNNNIPVVNEYIEHEDNDIQAINERNNELHQNYEFELPNQPQNNYVNNINYNDNDFLEENNEGNYAA